MGAWVWCKLDSLLFCDLKVSGLVSVWAWAGWLPVGLDLLILCLWLLAAGVIYVCGCGCGVFGEVRLGWTGLAGILDCMCWVGGVVCGFIIVWCSSFSDVCWCAWSAYLCLL